MRDPRDLMKSAQNLKDKAAHEADGPVRDRLRRMAGDYQRFAEGEAQKAAHPVDAAAIGDILTPGD